MTTKRGPAGRVWRALAGTEAPTTAIADVPPPPAWRRLDVLLAGAPALPGLAVNVSSLSNLTLTQPPARWDEVVVHSGSMAAVRQALPWLGLAGRTKRLVIEIAATTRPELLRAPAAVGRRVPSATSVSREDAGVTVVVELAKHTEVGLIARAVLADAPSTESRTAGLRVGLTEAGALAWSAGDPMITAAPGPADPALPPAVDVLVGTVDADPRVPRVTDGVAPVDTALFSPRGFLATTAAGVVEFGADGWLRWPDGSPRDVRAGLTENDLAALRQARAVRAAPGADPAVLAQLCCAGVPVAAADPALDAALGPDLAARLRALDPQTTGDDVGRESWSVDTRRLALARFAPSAHWARIGGGLSVPARPAPTVSVLLATRRVALLPFALAQLARQDWPDLQVVLVLHGQSAADPAVTAALAAFHRPVDVVEVGADVVFGRALNAGLDRCAGDLVTKFDDDDWYGPHHVTDLVAAHRHSGALLVGCGGYHVYLAGPDVTIRWTNVPTEALTLWVHGGTILLDRASLRGLGGFAPVPVGEDAALLATVRTAGGDIYGIHDLGFCYFRGRDHTWTPPDGDARWLAADNASLPGFQPPPQLDPLPHPWFGSR
ncbi:MAG TPA: glycosyltransferase family 2 protein [Sporichthyaceae bacterium]|jgi:hypothetical protein